jgi:transposase
VIASRWGRTRVMRSRIEPFKKVARSLRQHRQLILNWFKAQGEHSTGIVEGLNHFSSIAMNNPG